MLHRCVRGFGVSSEQCQTKLILGTGIFPKWLGSLDSGLSSCIAPCQSSTLCPLRRGLPGRLSVASGERRVELHKRVSCKILPFHALKPLAAVVVRYQKLMLENSTDRNRFGDTVGLAAGRRHYSSIRRSSENQINCCATLSLLTWQNPNTSVSSDLLS